MLAQRLTAHSVLLSGLSKIQTPGCPLTKESVFNFWWWNQLSHIVAWIQTGNNEFVTGICQEICHPQRDVACTLVFGGASAPSTPPPLIFSLICINSPPLVRHSVQDMQQLWL